MVLTGSLWIQAFDFLAKCFNANCHFADAIVSNPELLRLLAEDSGLGLAVHVQELVLMLGHLVLEHLLLLLVPS